MIEIIITIVIVIIIIIAIAAVIQQQAPDSVPAELQAARNSFCNLQ